MSKELKLQILKNHVIPAMVIDLGLTKEQAEIIYQESIESTTEKNIKNAYLSAMEEYSDILLKQAKKLL